MNGQRLIIPLPKAAWDRIVAAIEAAGIEEGHYIIQHAGRMTVAIPLDGIDVVPYGESDCFANSGAMSDFAVQSNMEAFYAGYDACKDGITVDRAWSNYDPSDAVLELQSEQTEP